MYYFESPVRFSEVDEAEYLRYGNIIDYFQDTSGMADVEESYVRGDWGKMGIVWIMTAWDIHIRRRPALGEKIKVGTGIKSHKHCFVDRYYDISPMDGEPIIQGMALWAAMSTENYLPKKVDLEVPLETVDMEAAKRKIAMPKDLSALGEVSVNLRDIDHNHHLNNAAYLKIALEFLPEGLDIRRIQIIYTKSWVKGNRMFIFQKIEDNKIYFSLRNELEEEYSRIILEVEE